MKTFIQIIVLFFCLTVQAQTEAALKQKLKTTSSPEAKAAIYLKLAQNLNYSKIATVFDYAQKAIQLSNNDKQIHADALQIIGNCYLFKGEYKTAIATFEKLKTIYQKDLPDNYTGLIKAIGSLGLIALEQNQFHQALLYNLEALKIAEKHNDRKMLASLHNNIGVIYRSTEQQEKAKNSFQKSLKLQIETNNNQAGVTLTNLAAIEIDKENYKKAYQLLQKAKPYLIKYREDRAWGEWYNNFGDYYLINGQFKEAENYLNQALKHFDNIEDQFGSADTHLLLASVFQEQKLFDKAIFHAKKALELGESLDILGHKQQANLQLSELFEAKGNIQQSFDHFKKYSQQKDSLINEENTRKITEADLNYTFQKKQLENEAVISAANTQKWIIILIAILMLISLFSYYLWKSKKQVKQKLLLEKELLEYEQKALHLQMNPHFVFNCLAAISSYIVQNKTEDATKYLAMFSKLMRFTLESSKESLITIDKEIESISQYLNLENLRLNKIFSFSIDKAMDIEDDLALPPMLLQPIVENAIIHGILPMKQTGIIKIKFYTNNNLLFIEVIDNGIGIDNSLKNKNKMSLHRSMAIDIVTKRLSMINKTQNSKANIQFEQQEQGTMVRMALPVQFV